MFKRLISLATAVIAALSLPMAALAQSPAQWKYTFQSGVATASYPGNVTVTNSSGVPFSIVNPRGLVNAWTVGINATGATAVSSQIQSIVSSGRGIYFPCGTYLFNSTVNIASSNIALVGESAACVNFVRSSNFGAMLNYANSAGNITNFRLTGISMTDLSAFNNVAGYSTCATSPYHVIMDGAQYVVVEDVRFAYGCGGLAIKGGYNIWLSHTQFFFGQIASAPGENNLGTALYVGQTTNSNISVKHSANIWVQDADVECGSSVSTAKCAVGYRMDGVDGVFNKSVHVEYAGTADFHLANNNALYMVNISCVDCFADIAPGNGVLLDGSSPVSNMQWSGSIDGATLNTAASGFKLSGSGGLNNSLLDVHVRGWGLHGIDMNASNTSDVVIRPHDFTVNNVSNSANIADINISQGSNITIDGGTLDGWSGSANQTSYGIQFGAGVTGANVVGVSSRRHSSLAMNVQNGSTNINVTGGDFTGNTVAGIQVLGPPASVHVNGTLGVPWFTYTPTIACGAGTITTLGTVTGRYDPKGTSLNLQMSIPITTIGTCATSITASLPTGVTTASETVIGGREVTATGKALTASAGGSGASTLQIQNYDNTFPGASGIKMVLNGAIEIQ